jgi:hypothetical protein
MGLTGFPLLWYDRAAKGLEFSIRTPGTPDRWAEYDIEMTSAWEVFLIFALTMSHTNSVTS